MPLSKIQKILKTIKIVLTIWGINGFLDFHNRNIFLKLHGILSAFIILILYTTGFYNEFVLNLIDRNSDNIGATFFLGNTVIGITTTVLRGILMVINRKDFLFLLNWLKEVHLTANDGVGKKYKGTYFNNVSQNVLKYWKYGLTFIALDSIFTPIGVYVFHKINPEFKFLLPIHVMGIPPESKYYYSVNFWVQTYGYDIAYHMVFIDFLIFYTITSHILAELTIINDICKDLGKHEEYLSEKYFNLLDKETSDIEVTVLPDENLSDIPSKILLIYILERHAKIVEVIKVASDFYFINILLNEAVLFAGNGFIYLVFTIFRDNYVVAMNALLFIPQYFMMSMMGARILEAGNEMGRTLYESSWLYLNSKQRKMLCVLMAMAQKPHTLTAGGFSDVSMARFSVVMSFSYRCCLLISFVDKKIRKQ